MSLNIFSQSQKPKKPWLIRYVRVWQAIAILLIAVFYQSQPGYTEEKTKQNSNNRLPPAPNTGSPEADFSSGGTRGNQHKHTTVCGVQEKNIVYLLGNRNREFTASAHPSFWFYFGDRLNHLTQLKFVLTELATGKKVYERVIQPTKESGIIGITLPPEPEYTLSPKVNYTWSLQANCLQTEPKPLIVLEGWLTHIASSQLENQLAVASTTEKSKIYLDNNLLYDALTELAQSRIAQPNNKTITAAWNQLLTELGWSELAQQQSTATPYILETRISRKPK